MDDLQRCSNSFWPVEDFRWSLCYILVPRYVISVADFFAQCSRFAMCLQHTTMRTTLSVYITPPTSPSPPAPPHLHSHRVDLALSSPALSDVSPFRVNVHHTPTRRRLGWELDRGCEDARAKRPSKRGVVARWPKAAWDSPPIVRRRPSPYSPWSTTKHAPTTIQARFRGWAARRALSKASVATTTFAASAATAAFAASLAVTSLTTALATAADAPAAAQALVATETPAAADDVCEDIGSLVQRNLEAFESLCQTFIIGAQTAPIGSAISTSWPAQYGVVQADAALREDDPETKGAEARDLLMQKLKSTVQSWIMDPFAWDAGCGGGRML